MTSSCFRTIIFIVFLHFYSSGFGQTGQSFLYTPEKVRVARENIARHAWAASLFDSLRQSAEDAASFNVDEIRAWIPEYTPTRVVDCPVCGTHWKEYIWRWSREDPDAILCRVCSTRVTAENYPDNDSLLVHDPQGRPHYCPVHRDSSGQIYLFRERLAYQRLNQIRDWLKAMAAVYAVTEDERFAGTAIRFLERLGRVYPGYALHDWERYGTKPWRLAGKISGWNYEDAVLIIACGKAYDATRHSELWDEETRNVVRNGLFRSAADFLTAIRPDKQIVNDAPFRYAGVAVAGRILNDPKVMRWVLDDELGVVSFMRRYWNYDGSWVEMAPSYHLMALRNFHAAVEALEDYSDPPAYQAADRIDDFDLRNVMRLQRIYESLFQITYPDDHLPPINDSHVEDVPKPLLADAAYAWFGSDDALRYLAAAYSDTTLDRGSLFSLFNRPPDAPDRLRAISKKIPRPSVDYDDLGIVVIRSALHRPETMLTLKYGGIFGGHDHMDKLSMTLFARDREMLSDLGYVYSSFKDIFTWMRRSLAHNTVTIDGINQSGLHCASELLHAEPGFQVSETRCPWLYHTITEIFNRQIIYIEREDGDYIVDLFRVKGGDIHDWSVHAETPDLRCDNIEFSSMNEIEGRDYAYEHLKNVRLAELTKGMEATWRWTRPPVAELKLHLIAPENGSLYLADAPAQRMIGQEGRTLPYIIVRAHQTGTTTFAAVWVPYVSTSSIQSVRLLRLEENVDAGWPVVISVSWENGDEDVLYSGLRDNPDYTIGMKTITAKARGRIGYLRLPEDGVIEHKWINAYSD
jgi:hypothetical protein